MKLTDAKRDELLLEIHEMLGEMKVKLDADYRVLHGNGQKGLIEKHNDLVRRVDMLEQHHRADDKNKSALVTWIGLLITAAGTIYAIFKHH